MNNNNCFNLCLSCGAPFLPDVNDVLGEHNVATLSMLYFERAVRKKPEMRDRYISKTSTPHFCTVKQNGHIVHKSYHEPAMRFVVQKHPDNKEVKHMPFEVRPTSAKNAGVWHAKWDRRPAASQKQRIVLGDLGKYMEESYLKAHLTDIDDLDLTETVPVCHDCNSMMTMKSRFLHLLCQDENPLVPLESITVSKTDAFDRDNTWKFPSKTEDAVKDSDLLTPLLAYYMQLCFPEDSKIKANEKNSRRRVFFQTHAVLAWTVLQIACLVREYRYGSLDEKDGRFRTSPKTLFGLVEFYTAYYGYVLSKFLYDYFSANIDFKKWHQMYIWDVPGSPTYETLGTQSLFNDVMPAQDIIDPKLMVQDIAQRLLTCYKHHMEPLAVVISQYNRGFRATADMDLIRAHFVQHNDIPQIIVLQQRADPVNNVDEQIRQVGIRCIWIRVLYIHYKIQSTPAALLDLMTDFANRFVTLEVERLQRRMRRENKDIVKIEDDFEDMPAWGKTDYAQEQANQAYTDFIVNPLDKKVMRGIWASVLDLWSAGALASSPKLARPGTNTVPIVIKDEQPDQQPDQIKDEQPDQQPDQIKNEQPS